MSLDTSLAGRRALVCGASAGIGRAAALALAGQGARLIVLARRAERLEALLPALLAAGAPEAIAVAADLDDRPGVIAALRPVVAGDPAHVLINNAGGPPGGPLIEAAEAAFVTALGRHLFASHALVQLLLPGMAAAGYGRIINVVSTSVREPIPNLGVSNTTRGAVASWAKSLSRELPSGVTINNVLPGFTDTERLSALRDAIAARRQISPDQVMSEWLAQVPEGRLAQPEETAGVIAFLASPAGGYVRGQSLAVDGGRLRSI